MGRALKYLACDFPPTPDRAAQDHSGVTALNAAPSNKCHANSGAISSNCSSASSIFPIMLPDFNKIRLRLLRLYYHSIDPTFNLRLPCFIISPPPLSSRTSFSKLSTRACLPFRRRPTLRRYSAPSAHHVAPHFAVLSTVSLYIFRTSFQAFSLAVYISAFLFCVA